MSFPGISPARYEPLWSMLPPAKSAAGFYHPGVLVNRAQLEFIKAKVAAGAQPWKSAFEAAKASELASPREALIA